MADKHLKHEPVHINAHWWYYEDKDGLEIYRTRDGGIDSVVPRKAVIPWENIRAALERKDRSEDV